MKFLCDNCKAKYQIADEKVAGKTVRMKCRKCGHQIEVRAAVTETSAAAAPPNAPAERSTQGAGLATSLSATKPREPSTAPPRGALAGAFASNVQGSPASPGPAASAAPVELSVTDEWYVAINGVPVGPVRISELRRRAAKGDVTEESLCWQEGLEEWRPIRSIPDLAALVREAAQGSRPSMLSPEPPRTSVAPRPPAAPRTSAAPPAPRATSPSIAPTPSIAPAPARSNVVPLRPAASAAFDEHVASPATMPLGAAAAFGPAAAAVAASAKPSAAPAPTPSPAVATAADPFAARPAPAPVAAAVAQPAPAPVPAPSAVPAPAYPPQKAGVPVWFVLVIIGVFGSGIAFLLFRPQPAPAPVVIQMPTATAPATAEPKVRDDVPPPTPTEPTAAATSDPKGKSGAVAAKATTPTKAPDVPEKKGLDLGNLVAGPGGPSTGPNTSAGGGAGGGLDQAGVERVVASHRNGVKRTCWERGGDQKSSANLMITANVAPNGSVSSTSSSGDDPVVAKCIENQVRTWQFPAPGSSTTINIPFKFVRQ